MKRGLEHKTYCHKNRDPGHEIPPLREYTGRPSVRTSGGMRISMGRGRGMVGGAYLSWDANQKIP